jgi:hypothetical protein
MMKCKSASQLHAAHNIFQALSCKLFISSLVKSLFLVQYNWIDKIVAIKNYQVLLKIVADPDWDQNFYRAHTIEQRGASSRGRHKAHVKFLGAHQARARSALWPVRA